MSVDKCPLCGHRIFFRRTSSPSRPSDHAGSTRHRASVGKRRVGHTFEEATPLIERSLGIPKVEGYIIGAPPDNRAEDPYVQVRESSGSRTAAVADLLALSNLLADPDQRAMLLGMTIACQPGNGRTRRASTGRPLGIPLSPLMSCHSRLARRIGCLRPTAMPPTLGIITR